MEKLTSWFQTKDLYQTARNRLNDFRQVHPRIGGGIAISVIFFCSLTIVFGWNLLPVAPGTLDHQVFEVKYGSSLRATGRALEARGLIRSELVFETYIRLNLRERMVKAGRYSISPGMSLPKVVAELSRGIPNQVRVTIPEGLTANEIANLLASRGLVDPARFLALIRDESLVKELMADFPNNHLLEGYLFPDTYYFRVDATETEIIKVMVNRFIEVFFNNAGELSPLQSHDAVILASIVEKEARKAEERPIIAGVFLNRLRLGYPLQSCATVQYALGKRKERLSFKDLEIQSPYNTYLHRGLPPSPIANPGLASLKAVLSPAKVSYLYFVARPNGSHAFSNTFEQHLRAQSDLEKLRY